MEETMTPGKWAGGDLELLTCCPACGGQQGTPLYSALLDHVFQCSSDRWEIYLCHQCESAYLNPRPSRDSISFAYRSYLTHCSPDVSCAEPSTMIAYSRRALRNGYLRRRHGYQFNPSWRVGGLALALAPGTRRRASRWVRYLDRPEGPRRLLDIGCGSGRFLLEMRSAGWQVDGIEPDAKAAALAVAAGLPVRNEVFGEDSFAPGTFDVITVNHVIEHVHQPVDLLRSCWRLLKPGGKVWIATPNLASAGHRRYGRNWRGLEPPRHLTLFTASGLARILHQAGFSQWVRMPVAFDAGPMFGASTAIARHNGDPADANLGATLVANLRSVQNPDRAEELAVVATRS